MEYVLGLQYIFITVCIQLHQNACDRVGGNEMIPNNSGHVSRALIWLRFTERNKKHPWVKSYEHNGVRLFILTACCFV